jgi:putative membrane protein
MNRYSKASCVLMTLVFGLPSVAQVPTESNAPKTAAESPDAAFVQKAAAGGMAEVELSEIAATTAASDDVRHFAQAMVHDHSANNAQLATIAAHENIAIPTKLDAEHERLRAQLDTLHGADFDRTYVDAMRADHQKMLDLLQSSTATVTTEELRTFIKQTAPVVQEHLAMARALKAG